MHSSVFGRQVVKPRALWLPGDNLMFNAEVDWDASECFFESLVLPRLYLEIIKTAVSITGPVFQAAERLAKSLGIPRSRLYSRAIERYVSEAQQRDITARLNQVYAGEEDELDPALAILQWASILREPW
jgi:hypothetical protein